MTETPLTDFLATSADTAKLDRFRADPATTAAAGGLSPDLIDLLERGHIGAIPVRGVQELERAGMAPLVSHKWVGTRDAET